MSPSSAFHRIKAMTKDNSGRALSDLCPKCNGAGWLWWNELDQYDGPAILSGSDHTRYSCDHPSHCKETKP